MIIHICRNLKIFPLSYLVVFMYSVPISIRFLSVFLLLYLVVFLDMFLAVFLVAFLALVSVMVLLVMC